MKDYTEKPITHLRKEYCFSRILDKSDLAENPIDQFRIWFENALKADLAEPNAVALATVDSKAIPSARMVLLKNFDDRGFVFYTNYNSRKAIDLNHNPHACLVFWWDVLAQQIRIEGVTEKISEDESDVYFAGREIGSKVGAWASNQSESISSRDVIET